MHNTIVERPQADEVLAIQGLHEHYQQLRTQISGVIVGMDEVIEQLVIALLCGGHCILEGVPGLAKTLLVSKVAELLGLSFRRIQFTPDLMPADITGTDILQEDEAGKRSFRFLRGPLFANIILADEINRTPPKTQSALLEAMQERQLTVGGNTYRLPQPFFVLATQNPIEQEGTYPLPEAQLDRFMLKVHVEYPSEAEEIDIVKRVTTQYHFETRRTISAETIEQMQSLVRKVPVGDHVYQYAVRLVRQTRPTPSGDAGAARNGAGGHFRGEHKGNHRFIDQMVNWGAGPRASIYLLLAAKARAVLHGRFHATTEDVAAMALPVLRHRVIPTFNAESAGQTSDDIVRRLLDGHAPVACRP